MKKYFFLILFFAFCIRQFAFARNWMDKGDYFPLKEINAKQAPGNLRDSLRLEMKKVADLEQRISNPNNDEIGKSVSSMKLYGIIAFALLAFICFRLFFETNRKLQTSTQILDSQISLAKRDIERYIYELEKEAVRIDNKLVQVLHEQLSLIKDERAMKIAEQPLAQFIPVTDHRLPIKVGEEIHRMRKRIENMDKETKGLGALVNSINRLGEELIGNGYEMEDLMGKKYVDGMKMEARFVDNPDIPPGEERITDVLRPEIKYKGEVIQVAKVEVGKSYE